MMKTRITFAISAFALALVAGAFAQAPVAAEKKVEPKCPISGKPINKDAAVDFDGGKVYMCCENCPAAFKKDEAKYAAKAHLQMVQTDQLKQVACPFSGHKLDPTKTVEVEGVTVAFCCDDCLAKAKKAKGDELVSLIFKDTTKGFKLAKDIKKDEAK
jgi:YHS domain-containing protein